MTCPKCLRPVIRRLGKTGRGGQSFVCSQCGHWLSPER